MDIKGGMWFHLTKPVCVMVVKSGGRGEKGEEKGSYGNAIANKSDRWGKAIGKQREYDEKSFSR